MEMPGRDLLPESAFKDGLYADPVMVWRREILRQTLNTLESLSTRDRYLHLACANVARWREAAGDRPAEPKVRVLAGDWGEMTLALTRELGETFAVLNMANAHWPGGAYVEGAVAQEEDMFRRTDCHFAVSDDELDPVSGRYRQAVTDLINGVAGVVYLETTRPRVCVRGPEVPSPDPSGYAWLPDNKIFPFFELRAAACDYRDGRPFDEDDARRRIVAQLETLIEQGIRHAVLGASGCGAFRNPSEAVARIYKQELTKRLSEFDCVAFAIYDAGYGPENFEPFERALADRGTALRHIEGAELILRLGEMLTAIEDGAVFEVSAAPSPFVFGPPSLGRVFAVYDDNEYGWPEPIEASAITSIEHLTPARRRHPLVTRNGTPIAMSISRGEYDDLVAHG
jgi:hypothetical protein